MSHCSAPRLDTVSLGDLVPPAWRESHAVSSSLSLEASSLLQGAEVVTRDKKEKTLISLEVRNLSVLGCGTVRRLRGHNEREVHFF